jgi:hypothetical protein
VLDSCCERLCHRSDNFPRQVPSRSGCQHAFCEACLNQSVHLELRPRILLLIVEGLVSFDVLVSFITTAQNRNIVVATVGVKAQQFRAVKALLPGMSSCELNKKEIWKIPLKELFLRDSARGGEGGMR